jgi:hypothetical protein
MAELTIRPAVAGDAEAVERLRVAGWKTAYRGIIPDAFLDSMPVDVERRRARTRRFYETCGFRPDGSRKLADFGEPVPEVRYRREVPAPP